ncbi:hypothetical protein GH714_044013 [Hevea brasiliensis]|uniref:Uncharacterized protein n=1 Tax=Hevea brasiliensis TaxID=3981 RepID=A0A6A6K2I7_HEVBR|nr:hypothetical protein GH714_044013 [Hevea brasiliensis]
MQREGIKPREMRRMALTSGHCMWDLPSGFEEGTASGARGQFAWPTSSFMQRELGGRNYPAQWKTTWWDPSGCRPKHFPWHFEMLTRELGVKPQPSVGAKSNVLPKFMSSSRMREELGSIGMRLDKVEGHLSREQAIVDRIEDHLIRGDDRFEELGSRVSELGEGLEETRSEFQAALKETRDKLVPEIEALKLLMPKRCPQ